MRNRRTSLTRLMLDPLLRENAKQHVFLGKIEAVFGNLPVERHRLASAIIVSKICTYIAVLYVAVTISHVLIWCAKGKEGIDLVFETS